MRLIIGIVGIVFVPLDAFKVSELLGIKTLSFGVALCFAALLLPI